MSTERRSLLQRALRVLLGLGAVVVIALTVAAWWFTQHGEAWLDRTLRERIAEVIDEASVEGYRFTMEELVTDVRSGDLSVTGVRLEFAPELLDSLRSGAYHYLFEATVDRIELRGLSFWRLLWRKEFRVRAFELKGPSFQYLISGVAVDLADPFSRVGGGSSIPLLSADSVLIRRASARVQDLGDRLPVMNIDDLSLTAVDVHTYMAMRRNGVRLAVGDADVEARGASMQLADGANLRIGSVRLSVGEQRGHVFQLQHEALPGPADTLARSVTQLFVDSIVLEHFEVDRLISHQQVSTGHVSVHGLRMHVELDKTLGPAPRLSRMLPPQALLDLGFPIRVDTLSVYAAHVLYRERDDGTEQWGELPFSELNAEFHHIANGPVAIKEHPRIIGEVSGLIFDTALVRCRYEADLDGSQRFTIHATLAEMPVTVLNGMTRPLMRMQMQSGSLEYLEMDLEGDDRKAKGSMAIRYADLKVRVEPGTSRKLFTSMFGNVLETMLKETYGGGLSADRQRKFNIARDPEKAFTGYLWHATREGLARNLVPEVWGRVRDMLRSDAEERRELRARRRARQKGP